MSAFEDRAALAAPDEPASPSSDELPSTRARGVAADHTALEAELQKRMRQLTEAQAVARLGHWELDIASGRLDWSDETFRIFERSREDFVPTDESFHAAIHPDDRALVDAAYGSSLAGQRQYQVIHRIVTPDGRIKWVEERCTHFFAAGGAPLRSLGTVQDVTERVLIEQERRRWAAVYENSLEGVMITDPALRIVDVNRAFTQISGYSREELLGQEPSMRKSDRHDGAFFAALSEALRTQGRWQGEVWNRRKDGRVLPEWISVSAVTDDAGTLLNYVCVVTDISALKDSESRLEYLATHDALTGLPNRALITDRLRHAFQRAQRRQHPLAALFVDLDGFKAINDTLGHAVGDRLLVAVGERLCTRMRRSDTVGRLGGDEFLVVLEDVRTRQDVARLAAGLVEDMTRAFAIDGHELYVGASIGIALCPGDAASAEDMVRNADTAMYRAKEEGKSTFAFYDAEMTSSARRRLVLEARMRQAMAGNAFQLLFQPKVSLRDGRIRAAEALIRWHDPELGHVPPDQFIPVAEANGLILAIGEWVLRESCRALARLRAAGCDMHHVAVNVSALQIQRGQLFDLVQQVLAECGLAPGDLEIEVTESLLIHHPEQAARVLGALRESGVRLALDDFGPGWSSLGSLKRFPFSALKIDRDFVAGIGTDPNDEAIVRAVVAMGQNLQLEVVAEGVECAAHVEFARALGCDYVQGYHFSPPVGLERLEELLRAPLVSGRDGAAGRPAVRHAPAQTRSPR